MKEAKPLQATDKGLAMATGWLNARGGKWFCLPAQNMEGIQRKGQTKGWVQLTEAVKTINYTVNQLYFKFFKKI